MLLHIGQHVGVVDVNGRGSGDDDDVNVLHVGNPLAEANHLAADASRELHRPVVRTVSHKDALGAARAKTLRRAARHVPCPDDEHIGALQPPEDVVGHLHGGGTHGGGPGGDVRPAADALADREDVLEGRVGRAVRGAGLQRRAVGLLELAEDFRLPDDHGVQPCGHASEVTEGRLILIAVEAGGRLGIGLAAEEVLQNGSHGAVGLTRPEVHLRAVAGGEQNALVDGLQSRQLLQSLGQVGLGHGERLAHGQGRAAMVEAQADKALRRGGSLGLLRGVVLMELGIHGGGSER